MCFKKSSPAPAPTPAAAPAAPAATPSRPPAATPPVTERTVEVEAASRQTRIDARKRRGMRATLLAGETGGYQAPAAGGEETKKTLLG
jgi:hypothetical protein